MSRVLLVFCLCFAGCGAKEAQDPHSLLGEYGEEGGAKKEKGKPPAPMDRVANAAECRAAARRIEELALDLVVQEEEDPEMRAELDRRRKVELGSEAFRQRIEHGKDECLGRETPSREAACIARAVNDLAIERCGKR